MVRDLIPLVRNPKEWRPRQIPVRMLFDGPRVFLKSFLLFIAHIGGYLIWWLYFFRGVSPPSLLRRIDGFLYTRVQFAVVMFNWASQPSAPPVTAIAIAHPPMLV